MEQRRITDLFEREDVFFSQLDRLEIARMDEALTLKFTDSLVKLLRSCTKCGCLASAQASYCKKSPFPYFISNSKQNDHHAFRLHNAIWDLCFFS
jgi:hypothetical protein